MNIMNDESYLTDRVDDQIAWYSKKSTSQKHWYFLLQATSIICAALIPLISGWIDDSLPYLKILAGILGFIVALAGGFLALGKFHENWLSYRTTAESLKHEKYKYLTESAPYDVESKFSLFVQNVEALISRENTTWAASMKKSSSSKK